MVQAFVLRIVRKVKGERKQRTLVYKRKGDAHRRMAKEAKKASVIETSITEEQR
jgi:hypothetical protein